MIPNVRWRSQILFMLRNEILSHPLCLPPLSSTKLVYSRADLCKRKLDKSIRQKENRVSWSEVPRFSSWIYSPRSKTKYRHTFRLKNIQFNWENRKAKRKLAWHILRMTTDRLPKVLLNYKPRGFRNIERPMATEEDAFSWSRKQACGLRPWSRRKRRSWSIENKFLNFSAGTFR
jgi:hypothetical protein